MQTLFKSLCAFDTCWWYNKMVYNVKYFVFTLHWYAICFSNRHFILVHLVTYILRVHIARDIAYAFTVFLSPEKTDSWSQYTQRQVLNFFELLHTCSLCFSFLLAELYLQSQYTDTRCTQVPDFFEQHSCCCTSDLWYKNTRYVIAHNGAHNSNTGNNQRNLSNNAYNSAGILE